MKKVIFIVLDGVSDRPILEFNRKTPLEVAKTPNLDRLAQGGISGAMHVIDVGIRPGSDTAHLALFGYDPNVYYTGRGPFESAGINMEMKPGDVCFRANMGTVDDQMIIVDRRAGRIDDTSEFAELFTGTEIDGVQFILKKGLAHRVGFIMRGQDLSDKLTDGDPHVLGVKVYQVKPADSSKEAKFTAEVLNKFLEQSHQQLKDLESNKKRQTKGLLPANYFLVRGAGKYPSLPSFKEKYGLKAVVIAGAGMYKGIARIMGMDVSELDKAATGKPDSDLTVKFDKLKELYEKYDFFFVHLKGADTLAEDGDYQGKKEFIEKIDRAIAPVFKFKDALVVVTADHSTPCSLKAHSADDVPVTIYGRDVRDDDVRHYNERECAKGRLGHIRGINLMPIIIDLMGLAEMFGA